MLRRLLLMLLTLVAASCSGPSEPSVQKPKSTLSASEWPGSGSTMDDATRATAAVIACTAEGDAEILRRHTMSASILMDVDGGKSGRAGGYTTLVRCRQRFVNAEVLHGDPGADDRVLEYSFVEKCDVPMRRRAEKSIPSGANVILLLGKDGFLHKALQDTKENRDAVQQAFARHREKQKPTKSA